MKLADILKDSSYKLSQFTPTEIEQLEQAITLKKTKNGEAPYTICLVRKKEIKLTPEEAIRQLYLRVLSDRLHYPLSRIQVEYGVNFGREVKRADIAVMDKDRLNTVYILVEVKSPKWKDAKAQLRSYCNATGSPMAVWTNGDQISYYQRKDPNYFEDISDIPNSNQTLADILQIKFTLDDLIANDKLVKRNKSLKTLIEEMEDEVLANAGVDVFEELFKLIFAKLYDEWYSGQGNRRSTRSLEFRNTGQTESALKTKIQDLFDKAKKKWPGVFSEDAKISLTPSHLSVCVSSLENVKLFNSNLDVIDEAFEYLIIFHVWRQILEDEGLEASHLFSLEEKPPRCKEYVEEKVFAIDFDEKAVRVARTLNLIAGDGQTNVLHLNTLDYELWDEVTQQEEWDDVYHEGFRRLKKLRPKGSPDYREFQFDILMANPPFAGDIKEPRMIARYDLAKKPNGKWETKVGRDILFIERNLDFLKPGGRMAIVLPQGRFNNSSDKNIRDFIAERCRILAVVGLHGNTFKPHTGTKTSVLLVQKWNDDPKIGTLCPRQDDYNIFFATMQKSGKDNSGEKVYVKGSDDSGDFLLDKHNHWIVDHDLFNHDGLTEDGIAEAFIEFAKKENLSFFEIPPANATPLNKGDRGGAFDAVKYQQLMDRLEAVEVNFSDTQSQKIHRLEAEFYIAKTGSFNRFLSGEEIIDFVQYGTSKDLNEHGFGYPILRLNEFESYFTGTPAKYCNLIDETTFHFLRLKKGDVVICRTNGNPKLVGKSALVPENTDFAFASYVFRVQPKKQLITPEVLTIFLNSDYGRKEIEKYSMTGNQTNFSPAKFREIQVPHFLDDFQKAINQLVEKAYQFLKYSKLIYQQAEDLLLTELGLKDWKPTEESIAVKSFSESFLSSGRLDAEYYQPKYDQALAQINSLNPSNIIQLEDILVTITNGHTPLRHDLSLGDVKFLTAEHIDDFQINYETQKRILLFHHHNELKRTQIKNGDILITIKGKVGNAAVVENLNKLVNINQDVALLRLKSGFNPYYLIGFLNSQLGKLLIEKASTGQINPFLSLGALKKLSIPVFSENIMENIGNLIQLKVESFNQTNWQSKQLLEIAKIGVEKAIETDEETATAWINQQLESLDISPLFKGGRGDQ